MFYYMLPWTLCSTCWHSKNINLLFKLLFRQGELCVYSGAYSEEFEAESRDDSGNDADQHGSKRRNAHISTCSHGNSTSQSCILYVNLRKKPGMFNLQIFFGGVLLFHLIIPCNTVLKSNFPCASFCCDIILRNMIKHINMIHSW